MIDSLKYLGVFCLFILTFIFTVLVWAPLCTIHYVWRVGFTESSPEMEDNILVLMDTVAGWA